MKGCNCHFTKWQLQRFIAKGANYNNNSRSTSWRETDESVIKYFSYLLPT